MRFHDSSPGNFVQDNAIEHIYSVAALSRASYKECIALAALVASHLPFVGRRDHDISPNEFAPMHSVQTAHIEI